MEVKRLQETFTRLYIGPAWHGPSLKQTLDSIPADKVHKKGPMGLTMAEMVDHILFWRLHLIEMLKGNYSHKSTEEKGWQNLGSEAVGWDKRLAFMQKTHEDILKYLAEMPESKLEEYLPDEKELSFYELIHGVAQHDMYHLGQLQLVRRAVEEAG